MQQDLRHIHSRNVGDVTVTIISEGTLKWAPELQAPDAEWRREIPEADRDGVVRFGLNTVLVQTGDATIVIDPGYDDPSPADGQREPNVERSAGLAVALSALGVAAEQVTHVLISHPHGDHLGGVTLERNGQRVARFPRARHLIGRADWEGDPEQQRPDASLVTHLGTIARLGLLDLTDGEHVVTPGVTMINAPGETPGHSIVRVQSCGATFYYVGDLFHHPCEVAHVDWVSPGRDRVAMQASRERFLSTAVTEHATVVFTHEQFPPWGRIVPEGASYRWRRE